MSDLRDVSRKLVAVFAADVEGYSRLMGADEVVTLKGLTERRTILDRLIGEHGGRIANTAGDSVLAEFGSAVDAVQCAVQAQTALADANSTLPPDRRISFRIGIHIGDVMIRAGDLFGDGVNIAARLQSIAKPGGVCISGATYDQVRKVLHAAFTDLGAQQVKNIQEPIRAYEVSAPSETQEAAPTRYAEAESSPPLPNKPSIAVLRFQNMSDDPEQEYFADGMVEDIITALSRFKSLFVIARNSSFIYKGKTVDIKQVGRELGVRYVLEGSVRKASGNVRITGQLIEAATNNHLWADKFDGSLEDVFDLQDKVTMRVVGSIAPKLEQAEIDRAKQKPTDQLDSYDCFLRGMALSYKGSHSDALLLYKRAAVIDPEFAAAHAMAAVSIMVPPSNTGLSLEQRSEAMRLAQLAFKLGSQDAFALARSAQVIAFFGHDYDQAEAMIEHALALNPNLAAVWFCRGWVSLNCGEPERALQSFEHMMRLSPLDPLRSRVWYGKALAQYGLGRYQEGCLSAMRAIQGRPQIYSLGAFVMNAVRAGRKAEAREAVDQLLRLRPNFRTSHLGETFPTRDTDLTNSMIAAFREAGLPE
jgi:TolB-like protein/class 3 adenylate cyclase